MKKILPLLLFILPIFSIAQELKLPVDSSTNKITYSEVISANDSKEELYKKGLDWVVGIFKSSNDVIQLKDEKEGKIIAKYVIKVEGSASIINVKMSLFFKDGRYKYHFTDFFFDGVNAQWDLQSPVSQWKMTKGAQKYIKKLVDDQVKITIEDLKKYMLSKSDSDF